MSLRIALLLTAAAGLPAQIVTVTATAQTPFGVGADPAYGTATQQALPTGSDVLTTNLTTRAVGPYGDATIAMSTTLLNGQPGSGWRVATQATVFAHGSPPFGTAMTSATAGPLDVLLTFTTTAPVIANVALDWQNTGTMSGLGTVMQYAAADVGADGTWELGAFNVPATVSVPVRFGPGDLHVRVHLQSLAAATATTQALPAHTDASTSFEVLLLPDYGCTVDDLGGACGLLLTGQPNFAGAADLTASGMLPSTGGIGAMTYGFVPTATPIALPPGCTLLLAPVAMRLLLPDASGTATDGLAIAPAFGPFLLFAQAGWFELGAGTVVTSGLLQVSRP